VCLRVCVFACVFRVERLTPNWLAHLLPSGGAPSQVHL